MSRKKNLFLHEHDPTAAGSLAEGVVNKPRKQGVFIFRTFCLKRSLEKCEIHSGRSVFCADKGVNCYGQKQARPNSRCYERRTRQTNPTATSLGVEKLNPRSPASPAVLRSRRPTLPSWLQGSRLGFVPTHASHFVFPLLFS